MPDLVLPKGVFRLSRGASAPAAPPFPYGLEGPGLHELCEARHGDHPAVTGFALALAAPRSGAVTWVSPWPVAQAHGRLYEAGLGEVAPRAAAFLHIRPRRYADTLWALEEAVSAGATSLVVGEVERLDFTASRRLHLASVRTGVPIVLLSSHRCEGATAAADRWRIRPLPSALNPFDRQAPGALRWHAVLERSRTVPEKAGTSVEIECHGETFSVRMVSGMAADTPAPRAPERAGSGALPFRSTA